MRAIPTAALLVVLSCGGCGGAMSESTVTANGVTIQARVPGEVKSAGGGKSSDEEAESWSFGGLDYAIDHGRLKVEGQDYGEVKAGDQVEIAPDGVFINGSLKQPVEAVPE